jgi:hypothetical protein
MFLILRATVVKLTPLYGKTLALALRAETLLTS